MGILNGISVLVILAMVYRQYMYIRKKVVPPKFVLVTYKGYLLTYRSNTVVQKTQFNIFGNI